MHVPAHRCMVRLASLAVFAVYLVVLAWPSVIVVDWLANRERITKELCVARELPPEMNNCNGQCHLAKQLKITEEAQQKSAQEPEVQVFQICAEPARDALALMLDPSDRRFPSGVEVELCGHYGSVEPVPRG